jgi:hypothetical protein
MRVRDLDDTSVKYSAIRRQWRIVPDDIGAFGE